MLQLVVALVLALGLVLPAAGVLPAGAAPERAGSVVVQIDTPTPGAELQSLDRVAGWAVDKAILDGTGIDLVAIYVDGDVNTGTFLGLAEYGLPRPDVAAVFEAALSPVKPHS